MSGHLAFPNTPAASLPASLSSWFLKDILRERIGFRGLIITDDLMMNGATMSAGSLSRAVKQALEAGNDIIMLSKTPNLFDPVWMGLTAAMKTEPLFRDRVRDAALRVLTTKLIYLRGDRAVPLIPDPERIGQIPDPEGTAFFLDLAARSVTVVKGYAGEDAVRGGDGDQEAAGIIPLVPEKAGTVLLAGQYEDFFNAGRAAYPGALSYWYAGRASAGELLRYAREVDTVIFCISDAEGMNLLRNLRTLGKRVILFSVLSPVYLDEASWVDGAIAVYSYAPQSFVAGFSALLGRIPAQGKLPYP
jgi:beta-N-acetylhexosaminidase